VTTQRSDGATTTAPPAAADDLVPTHQVSASTTDPESAGRIGTGSRGTRILGIATLAGIALATYLALVSSPDDESMGDVVRIIYVHVPIVVVAYVGCMITTLGSAMYLWKKSVWWDITAAASAEIAMVTTALTLLIGMAWARPTWGVWWVWDARLTSTAMLLLFLLGYLAVRRIPASTTTRSRRSAVVGLLLFPNVVIVNRSVTWWRSLHQDTTILNTLQPKIHDEMAFALYFAIPVALAVFAWLLIHRWRLAWLEEQLQSRDLDQAIVDRRAEAGFTPSPGDPGPTATPAKPGATGAAGAAS
jgi:heme exporter protein C